MTEDERDAMWICKVCGKWWVVPSLATLCAEKHRKEGK